MLSIHRRPKATTLSTFKQILTDELQQFNCADDTVTEIRYPVARYPEKVTSIKLDKIPAFEKKLVGIKGQYLIFDDDTVLNLRSHAGYQITLEA